MGKPACFDTKKRSLQNAQHALYRASGVAAGIALVLSGTLVGAHVTQAAENTHPVGNASANTVQYGPLSDVTGEGAAAPRDTLAVDPPSYETSDVGTATDEDQVAANPADGSEALDELPEETITDEPAESEGADEGAPKDDPIGEEAPGDFLPGNYTASPLQPGMLRLSGTDRYSTSAQVAARVTNGTGTSHTVFIASGSSYADGLTIGALAAYTGSPVLLVQQGKIPTTTVTQLQNLRPERIVVAGGAGAVSNAVLDHLGQLAPDAQIQRIGGSDRYKTAALIASNFPKGAPVFIATGLAFPDALSAGAAASKVGGPILLSPGFKSSSTLTTTLQGMLPDSVYIVGGHWAQSDLNAIRTAAGATEITSLSGSDRYATSAAVAKQFWGLGATTTVYATGKGYADGMIGISAARAFDAPVLLSSGGCRTPEVAQVGGSQTHVVVLGGLGAMSAHSYNTDCITPSKTQAAPTFNAGTYSFNITWSGQQRDYWCGPSAAYMVLNRLGWSKSVSGLALTQANLASNTYLETERYGRTLWPGNYMGRGIQRWTGQTLYSQHPSPNAAALRSRVMDSFLETGRPVMVHQTIKPDRPIINNQRSRDTTHVMVVNSYNPVTDTLTMLDPAAGVVWPLSARSFTIKVSDMARYLGELGLYY